jgi:hypothetical protein
MIFIQKIGKKSGIETIHAMMLGTMFFTKLNAAGLHLRLLEELEGGRNCGQFRPVPHTAIGTLLRETPMPNRASILNLRSTTTDYLFAAERLTARRLPVRRKKATPA